MTLRGEAKPARTNANTGRRPAGKYDAMQRDPGPDFSADSLAAQTAAFLSKGGKVQQLPAGKAEEEISLTPNQRRREQRKPQK